MDNIPTNKRYRVKKDYMDANPPLRKGDCVYLTDKTFIGPVSQKEEVVVENTHGDCTMLPAHLIGEFLEGFVESSSDERTVNNVMRHAYRVLSDEEKQQMQTIKDMGLDFHEYIDDIGNSRELSLAKTKVEEAVMWAVKHVTG